MTDDTDFLAEIEGDLQLFNEKHWPRSQQVETGASSLFACRAERVFSLTKYPKPTADWSWEAWVGSAIDERMGYQRLAIRPWLLVQHRAVYRGVPATIDEFDPQTGVLTDWKSRDDAAACRESAKDPKLYRRAQVHLGAAGLIAEGYEVKKVRLCFLPRSGPLQDPGTGLWRGAVYEEDYDQELADLGAQWSFEMDQLAADILTEAEEENPEDPLAVIPSKVDGLRDELPSFCFTYCPFATVCRPGNPDTQPFEPAGELETLGRLFLSTKREVSDVMDRYNWLKAELAGAPPILVDGMKIAPTKDGRHVEEVPDYDRLDLRSYELAVGPVPTKRVAVGKAPYLLTSTVQARGKAKPKTPKESK